MTEVDVVVPDQTPVKDYTEDMIKFSESVNNYFFAANEFRDYTLSLLNKPYCSKRMIAQSKIKELGLKAIEIKKDFSKFVANSQFASDFCQGYEEKGKLDLLEAIMTKCIEADRAFKIAMQKFVKVAGKTPTGIELVRKTSFRM